jgi:hypothetical protein
MTMNLYQPVPCDYDLSSGDFRDDSFESTEATAMRLEAMPLCDIVFGNFSSESSKLDVHRVADIGLKHNLSSESDEIEDDDAISSSSSAGFYCGRVPASPSSTVSDNDPVGDISIDSNDSSTCFHPLSKQIDSQNEASVRNSPVLFELHINDTVELSETVERSKRKGSYAMLRFTYLLVTLVIMLADGLQGKSQESVIRCLINRLVPIEFIAI